MKRSVKRKLQTFFIAQRRSEWLRQIYMLYVMEKPCLTQWGEPKGGLIPH